MRRGWRLQSIDLKQIMQQLGPAKSRPRLQHTTAALQPGHCLQCCSPRCMQSARSVPCNTTRRNVVSSTLTRYQKEDTTYEVNF